MSRPVRVSAPKSAGTPRARPPDPTIPPDNPGRTLAFLKTEHTHTHTLNDRTKRAACGASAPRLLFFRARKKRFSEISHVSELPVNLPRASVFLLATFPKTELSPKFAPNAFFSYSSNFLQRPPPGPAFALNWCNSFKFDLPPRIPKRVQEVR